ncbi:MAG: hypothetical protein ACXVBF_08860 [Flavisolibacter sp.]
MKYLKNTGLCLALVVFSGSVFAEGNVTGSWSGAYYASQVKGPAQVSFTLTQTGTVVKGEYKSSTGVAGVGEGTINGQIMHIDWTNTTSCSGKYSNDYQITPDYNHMTWTFTGVDCAGKEEGNGSADRK